MSRERIELTVLELFVAVVDGGSIGAGARSVGMAQPNASRLLAELEARVDAPLLERTPRGSRPTEAGLQVAARARDVLAASRELEEWIGDRGRGGGPRVLRVGASSTIAENLLPPWLAELRRGIPQLGAHVTVANSMDILDRVHEGALDLGFVETPLVPVWLNAMVVREDELVVVIHPSHPWADRRGAVGVAELAGTSLVVREEGSGTRDALRQYFADAGYTVGAESPAKRPATPEQVLSSSAAIRVAVASGSGPAVLSELAVRAQLRAGDLLRVPLAVPIKLRPLTAVWSGPRRLAGPPADLLRIAAAP